MQLLSLEELRRCTTQLADLLQDAVEDGASVGFLPPLTLEQAEDYWQGLTDDVAKGNCLLWIAQQDERTVGTVQLLLAGKANGLHRAEVAKLLVHTTARRQGVGRLLMLAAEEQAASLGRSTLVLDTRQGDAAEALYQAMGYHKAGTIPQYARSASGDLDATTFYYKLLPELQTATPMP